MKSIINIWNSLSKGVHIIIIICVIGGLGYLAYSKGWIPGIKSIATKLVKKADIENTSINVKTTDAEMPVPKLDESELADVKDRTEVRVMDWVWFATAPIFTANGGLNTVKGSLMDNFHLNLKITTDNSVDNMKAKQLSFIKAYADAYKKGHKDANPEVGVHFVSIMGDGATQYIPAMNKDIRSACGEEFQLKIVSMFGFSQGEDCGLGLKAWKDNPELMKGSVWSAVIGDGDWGVLVRFFADLGLHVNPDPTAWDKDAVNFVPAPDNDFLKAAQQLFTDNYVTLKVKSKDGNFTGETVKKKIEGAATWFPGDRQVFQNTGYVKIISTAQYSNQMACVFVGCDAWMKNHSKTVVDILSAALTAGNQIKTYDSWFKYATNLAPKVFCADPTSCSESASDWYKFGKPGGAFMQNKDSITVSAGGTLMANLADNLKYFGVKGGNNYYKSIYEYFNGVLMDLNPAGFKESVGEVTKYDDAVDLSYLSKVTIATGATTKVDYSENKGQTFAQRDYHIEFKTGSAEILPEGEAELEKVFASMQNAVKAKANLVGYTDNQGTDEVNVPLSKARALAVKKWLIARSNDTYPSERINVDGRGSNNPVAPNETSAGRAKNRRVHISLTE